MNKVEICDALEKGAEFVDFTKTPKSAVLKELGSYIGSLRRN